MAASSSPLNYSFLLLLLLLLFFTLATSFELPQLYQKRTSNLHFYFHEIGTGPNATIYTTVSPQNTPNGFGQNDVLDCVLRLGPEPTSLEIGRAKGVYIDTDLKSDSALTVFSAVFSAGQFKGGSLVFAGLFAPSALSERPIIGGTGCFRMARGISQAKIIRNRDNLLIAEFDVYVEHYDYNLAEV